ncbi:lamin tail domain-containing protein [Microbacterium jejuense]|uniref:lamin tail domain-containing protein n=1 Tax=Microbacterium jejuense TaxID=1263637 RepID=UPI0031EC27A8
MRDASRLTAILTTTILMLGAAALAGSAAQGADRPAAALTADGSVILTEVVPAGSRGADGGFFELTNLSGEAVDLSPFTVYRCSAEGLRAARGDAEGSLHGVVLAAGERRAFPTSRLDARGYGLIVIGPGETAIDAIAVYPDDPAPTMSECGGRTELPVTTAAAIDESWQLLGSDPDGAWVRATATPGARNRVAEDSTATVRIDELAAAGPGGHGDDFVELRNTGAADVSLAGWRVYRCTATGAAPSEALQHVFADDARLVSGARLVIGGPGFTAAGRNDVRTATSLADTVSGVLLVDAGGRRVDGVGVSSHEDTACQSGRDKLPAVLDYRTGESWQRQADGAFAIASRTPGAPNAAGTDDVAAVFTYSSGPGVAVSEIATDPRIEGTPRRNFVEIANFSDHDVDISGWTLVPCGADGFRRTDDLAVVAHDTVLAPDDTYTAALSGTAAAKAADARYVVPLELAGAGVWLQDAAGRRIDSVGVYHRNEMDDSVDRDSACTKGLALSTFAVDRLRGETLQRVAFTGDDASDFAPAAATPGVLAHVPRDDIDHEISLALDTARAELARTVAAQPAALGTGPAPGTTGDAVEVLAAYTGSSARPLATLGVAGERATDGTALVARDDGYDLPYLRLRARMPADGVEVTWQGRTVGRAAVRLSVWAPASDDRPAGWRSLDEAWGSTTADAAGSASSGVTLAGAVHADEAAGGVAELLVQVVPRAESAAAKSDGLADPADYDVALGHLTDTQYYTEQYPEVYAGEVAWFAENAAARKIAFVTHTGDLVQNWVDPDQPEERARREFATASRLQEVLDESGIPNSVLPGNHDSKRGVTRDLFNEYFGPDRYRDAPWYGGSLTPDDNGASWSWIEAGGARLVMISLPYAYGEPEIAWAEQVVASHPDANVVISTHEHLTPATADDDAERSTTSRWVSHGDQLWERVVAPHRNVVLVLSGHFHGIGAIVTENAGGIPGHTVLEALADYQEFRTPSGERATGFQRLLQVDLAAGMLAVDTFSVPLAATSSHPYDYEQFLPDDGDDATPSNERPWRILADGLQQRYTDADDEFAVPLALQHAKAVETDALTARPLG